MRMRSAKTNCYDLLREGFQFPALGLNVLCAEDGAYKGHTVHAGALQLQDVVLVDAADGHHRHIYSIADVDEGLPGQDVDVLLGVGSKSSPHAQTVGPVGHSVQRFLYRVGRNTDHHILAHALAHLGGGHVALAHMDALGMALHGHVHVVVDEQWHAVLLAQAVNLNVSKFLFRMVFSKIAIMVPPF